MCSGDFNLSVFFVVGAAPVYKKKRMATTFAPLSSSVLRPITRFAISRHNYSKRLICPKPTSINDVNESVMYSSSNRKHSHYSHSRIIIINEICFPKNIATICELFFSSSFAQRRRIRIWGIWWKWRQVHILLNYNNRVDHLSSFFCNQQTQKLYTRPEKEHQIHDCQVFIESYYNFKIQISSFAKLSNDAITLSRKCDFCWRIFFSTWQKKLSRKLNPS